MAIKYVKQAGLLDGTYKKIAEDLESNKYPVGTKLQPLRVLAKNYNVSYMTMQKAIKVLQMQGTLKAKPGDGIYVSGKPRPLEGEVADYLERSRSDMQPEMGAAGRAVHNINQQSLCVVMPYWVSERGSACIYKMIKGILAASDPHHWSVELIHSGGDETHNESGHPDFIQKIKQRQPQGVIWLQPILTHKMNIMRLVDCGYKVVITGRSFPDVPVKGIHMDYDDMARKATEHFLGSGCKKVGIIVGYLEGQFEDMYSVDIVNALRRSMQDKGMAFAPESICQAGYKPTHKEIIKAFIQNNPDLDGIVCLHEHILDEIEKMDHQGQFQHLGRKAPLIDVSGIFNFDEHHLGQPGAIEHLHIEWPLENIGRAIVREFESEWLDEFSREPIDLSVKLVK